MNAQDDPSTLDAIVRSQLSRTPASIVRIEAGLGTRRFYRIHFENGTPRTLIARIEDDGTGATGANEIRSPDSLDVKEIERADPAPQLTADVPPSWLPEPALEPLRSFLEEAGLPVPFSAAHLPELGIDLLEDVGSRTLGSALPPARFELYREACSLVPRLQRLRDPHRRSATAERIPAFERALDRRLISTKCWKFIHWTLPGLLGRQATAAERAGIEGIFDRISDLLMDAPRRLAHRDFKAENLHLMPAIPPEAASVGGVDRLVMIDVQGAFMAPPEYDLVCLLYDLQVDLDEDLIQALFRSTLADLPDVPNEAEAAQRFDAIAVIRLCKDLAHVIQAGLVRGDRRRWQEIPRGLELLGRASGRLEHTFPEIRALTSVIQALTAAVGSSDSQSRG